MAAEEFLCQIAGINPQKFSKNENLFLEAELFIRACDELKEVFKIKYKEYSDLIQTIAEMENNMLEANFIKCIINDILLTEEYTLEGIACYTQTPEEVIYDIATGNNITPSLSLSRKIIEIHRSVRADLYKDIFKKIISTIV
jgi:hypothetical protein